MSESDNTRPIVNVSLSQAVDIDITEAQNLKLTFTAPGWFRIPGSYKGNFFPPLPDGQQFATGDVWPAAPAGAQPMSSFSVGYTSGAAGAESKDPVMTGMKTIKSGSGLGGETHTLAAQAAPAGFTGMKTVKSGS